jgi:hypothetical protein
MANVKFEKLADIAVLGPDRALHTANMSLVMKAFRIGATIEHEVRDRSTAFGW